MSLQETDRLKKFGIIEYKTLDEINNTSRYGLPYLTLPDDNGLLPVDLVNEHYLFPFALRELQLTETNRMCAWERVGLYHEPGVGKTTMSTHQALYYKLAEDIAQWLVVMPPILLTQWERWLTSIKNLRTQRSLSVTVYAGTPKQRAAADLNADFILMSYGILKNDFERLYDHFEHRKFGVICDEATAIKNHESDTHKAIKTLCPNLTPLMLLTGTPINKPKDAYAYIKLICNAYRNMRQFEQLHVKEVDEWGSVVEWQNLDLLASNLRMQSSRILLRDARKDMPEPLFTTLTYKLDPAHMKLYRRIVEERLVEFEDGSEIDAISASALRSALQQVVVNWTEFEEEGKGGDPAVLDLIEEVLEEIGHTKLVVAAHFIRTNRYLLGKLAKYGAVALYGEVSSKDKESNIQRFINDPTCKVLLLQPTSAGLGVDGLQHVCHDMIFVEAPTTPIPFNQTVARLDRDGQKNPVHVRVAVALGTVQVGMFKDLLNNDELANSVQRSYKDLKESVYGNE